MKRREYFLILYFSTNFLCFSQVIYTKAMKPIKAANKIFRMKITNKNFISHSDHMPEISNPTESSSEESHFSSKKYSDAQETYKLFVSSWNVGGITPPDNLNLEELLNNQNGIADIYVFGFQEIVPLNAGNILVQENVNISMKWNSLIKAALMKRVGTEDRDTQSIRHLKISNSINSCDSDFKCIISKQMVGIYITIWVRTELYGYISHPSVSTVGCGILGRLGNKGSVSVRFYLHGTSFCFVCCHLASGGKEGDERRRNRDAAQILEHTSFPSECVQHPSRKILDHDKVIWLGDLNYRIGLPEATTRSLARNEVWSIILQHDQLKAELAKNHVFEGWKENEIEFAPTYKYYQSSDDYYGSNQEIKAKRWRAPAWCDRIIWFGKGLTQIQYNRGESRLSDHRPVRSVFLAYAEVLKSREHKTLRPIHHFKCSANLTFQNQDV